MKVRFSVAASVALFMVLPLAACSSAVSGASPQPSASASTTASVIPSDAAAVAKAKSTVESIGAKAFTDPSYKPGTVRHIVLFRYAPSATNEQIAEVEKRFIALKTESKRDGRPLIVTIETGLQISGEGAGQGLQQAFVVTFASEGDLNYYVGKPVVTDPQFYDSAHDAFKAFVGPFLDKNGAVVFDYNLDQRP